MYCVIYDRLKCQIPDDAVERRKLRVNKERRNHSST